MGAKEYQNPSNAEDYIALQPLDRQEPLIRLRQIILKNLPQGFVEVMQYGMIGYAVPHSLYPSGYHVSPKEPLPFMALANQKGYISLYHLALYADHALMSWFKDTYEALGIGKLDMGKSCIHFKKPEKIPYELIAELCKKITVKDYIRIYESGRKL